MDQVKVLETSKAKLILGKKCQSGDYATVHWKTFNDALDKVEDSREYRQGKPLNF